MARVFLGIGSNINRELNLGSGLQSLAREFPILAMSRVYESDPVGFSGDRFFNMVILVETGLSVSQLQEFLREIELAHGPKPPGLGSRALDIDILLYDREVGEVDGVVLPREEILRSAFVLWPLADIAPLEEHPVEGKTFRELWSGFDRTSQAIWPVEFDLRMIA